MSDALDPSVYELPPGALSSLITAEPASDSAEARNELLARLRARIEAMRTEQEVWGHQFDELNDDAIRGNFSTPFLLKWIVILLDKQRDALENFSPYLDALSSNLAEYKIRGDLELQEVCNETMGLIIGWIRPYQSLCGALIDLTSERRGVRSDVLRTHPVKGKIDYAELSREHIARYPKIRARLAE